MKTVVFLLAYLMSYSVFADNHATFTQQSKAAIKEFSETLKGALLAAVKSGGPVEAITVCNQVAPLIAQDLSAKYNLQIGRTSLKVRNPANQPDAWEKDALTQLEMRKNQGEAINSLVISESYTKGNFEEMRLMKAIPTGKLCLTCHGSDIPESVQTRLNQLYPDDQATGFALGDIRGAFTIRKTVIH